MLTFTALPTPWNTVAQLLIIAIVLLLAGGFFLSAYDRERLGRMPKRTELPQSFLLIILALIVWLTAARQSALATLSLLTLAGIVCGFLGDLFMADVFKQENHVLFGMAAFALGHVFYMLGFREIALSLGLHNITAYIVAVLALWAVAVVIWLLLIRNPAGEATLQYAALVYALFLASMAGYATGLALQNGTFWPLAIGGILFLLSDALIAARLFGGRRFAYLGDIIWATYILAQMLIVTVVPVVLAL